MRKTIRRMFGTVLAVFLLLLVGTVCCCADEETAEAGIVYLAGNGKGDGKTADFPLGDLNCAIRSLGDSGTIVICAPYTVTMPYTMSAHAGKITLTSYDGITDYRSSGACLRISSTLYSSGETVFENLNFEVGGTSVIYGKGYPLTLGEGLASTLTGKNTTHIALVAGYNNGLTNPVTELTILSGEWSSVRGGYNQVGMRMMGLTNNIRVEGGIFHSYFACGSRAYTSGKVNANISGGTFYGGLYGLYEEDKYAYDLNFDITMNISGGTFYGIVGPAKSYKTVLHGSYTVNLTGGDFGHLTDLRGAENYAGNMTSKLNVSPTVKLHAEETGTTSFTNPIRANNADPFLMYYDGFYYYTCTGSTTIGLIKAANLADIKTNVPCPILTPTTGQNLWSPEIHYFSAAEVGAENAGWYMFISYDDGKTANQRQHVVKCLDGDNLLGRWGDPVTGEVNVPRHVDFIDAPSYNSDQLGGGMSVNRIDGKTYITFVSEEGRGTSDFHQTINICQMKNPWTMVGTPTMICEPTEMWEMGGYGESSTQKGAWYPKVVEGAAAVYGDNGEVYLMYTGSGYWTVYYQLGYLKFTGGDPLDASNWVKNKHSIFSRSGTVNGCGHGSYITDPFGINWIAYHAYLGKDTSSKRSSFFEPYTVDGTGVSIGDGSGHPAALDTVYTVPINPMPLANKITGFDTVSGEQEPAVTETTEITVTTEPEKVTTVTETSEPVATTEPTTVTTVTETAASVETTEPTEVTTATETAASTVKTEPVETTAVTETAASSVSTVSDETTAVTKSRASVRTEDESRASTANSDPEEKKESASVLLYAVCGILLLAVIVFGLMLGRRKKK